MDFLLQLGKFCHEMESFEAYSFFYQRNPFFPGYRLEVILFSVPNLSCMSSLLFKKIYEEKKPFLNVTLMIKIILTMKVKNERNNQIVRDAFLVAFSTEHLKVLMHDFSEPCLNMFLTCHV